MDAVRAMSNESIVENAKSKRTGEFALHDQCLGKRQRSSFAMCTKLT